MRQLSPVVPESNNNSPAPRGANSRNSASPLQLRPVDSAASTTRSAGTKSGTNSHQGTARSGVLALTADQGVSNAVVPYNPKPAWDPRSDDVAEASDQAKLVKMGSGIGKRVEKLERIGLMALAVLDNVMCYVTFGTVRAFHSRMYNIVDLHLTLLTSVDVVLLLFAAIGTATFVAMLVLIECLKLPLFNQIMIFRLYASALPCGFICAVLVFYSEQTQWAPFVNLLAIMLLVLAWCLHMRIRYSHELNVFWKIVLDISWFMALVSGVVVTIFFASNSFNAVMNNQEQSCPYAANDFMPVHVPVVDRWYCADWNSGSSVKLNRAPATTIPMQLLCSDTYVSRFGVSIEPHVFQCPEGCLRTLSSAVVGCNIYSLDTPICPAAVHSGVLTDEGGVATVYGRVGVAKFQRCSRNSLLSEERTIVPVDTDVTLSPAPNGQSSSGVAAPLVYSASGIQIEQAFHFNNQPSTEEFVWLKSYETRTSRDTTVNNAKPWTRIEATVSSRVAGVELQDEKQQLGQPADLPGQDETAASTPAQCRATLTGVLCRATGAAAIRLDFCQPEVKQCIG